jgi:hypothetical protein
MAKPRRRDSNVPVRGDEAGAPQLAGDTKAASVGRERIAARAYELYVTRGGRDGRDLDDWLEAERDLARARDEGNQDGGGSGPAA